MANANKPRGLVPVATISGAPWMGHVRMCSVRSANGTAIFRGDLVKIDTGGAGGSMGDASYVAIAPAAATDTYYGVFIGPHVDRSIAATEHPGYIPASTAAFGLVCVGEDVIYEVQEDNIGNDLALTDIGSVGNHVAGAGSTTTGVSAHVLDSSDVRANTSGHGLQLIGLVPKANNAVGTYAKWLVRISRSQFKLGL